MDAVWEMIAKVQHFIAFVNQHTDTPLPIDRTILDGEKVDKATSHDLNGDTMLAEASLILSGQGTFIISGDPSTIAVEVDDNTTVSEKAAVSPLSGVIIDVELKSFHQQTRDGKISSLVGDLHEYHEFQQVQF